MYMNLKKSASLIILSSIVATANISIFSGYATGPSDNVQTELGESNDLTIGCSKLHKIKLSDELTYEENDKLVKEFNSLKLTFAAERNRIEYLQRIFKKLEQKFQHDIFSKFAQLKPLQISYKNLVRAKIEFKNCKIKDKKYKSLQKSLSEKQKLFNDQCEEFRTELRIADDMLSQLKGSCYEYMKQQNEGRKHYDKYIELEAKYYNLNKFDEYNSCVSNYFSISKQQNISGIGFFNFARTADDLKIKGLNKFLELLEETLLQVNWGNQQAKMLNDVDLLDLFKELSKSESDTKPWVQTLNQYILIRDKNTQIESTRSLENSKMNLANGRSDQAKEDFNRIKYKLQNEILSKYKAEHAKSKTEVGASVAMEYNNKQFGNNTSEEVKSVEKSDVEDSPKGTGQVKIDKSSDYNKEKKLRAKEERRKNKKIAKRGTIKAKDINYQSENNQENAGVFIKAKIIRKEESGEKVKIPDMNDTMAINSPEETGSSTQLDYVENIDDVIEDVSDDSIESEDTVESDSSTDDSIDTSQHNFIKQYIPNAQFFRFDQ